MNREIILLINALASEKNVTSEIVFNAVEYAISLATKKKLGVDGAEIEININRETGQYKAFRKWLIVQDEDYTYPDSQKTIEEIQEEFPDSQLQIGDYYKLEIEAVDLGRIGVQNAKQMIVQKIRDAEKEQSLNKFLQTKEKLIKGRVVQLDRGNAIIEIGQLEAILPKNHMIPRELLRVKDEVIANLYKIEKHGNKTSIILTRISKEFLIKLMENHIPEIEDGLIEIKAVAREPGIRAKVAVKSGDPRIDPQGTCIGVRGSRVNAITEALAGERIDIVLWSPEPAEFIINAISPAKVTRILIDEEIHKIDIIVNEDQLALAIGRNGQNVKLASELTGWNINILTIDQADAIHKDNDTQLKELFEKKLNLDSNVADILVKEGFMSIEEIAYVSMDEILTINDFDEQLATTLRSRAKDVLLTEAMETEEKIKNIDENLKKLDNINQEILTALIKNNINTRDKLAELAVDELIEITGANYEQAEKIIISARAHWFNHDKKEG